MNCRWLNAVGSALLLSTALVTVSCSRESRGVLFYVSATDGNDANNGSASSPWRTIQKAAKTVGAGATVIVSTGVFKLRNGMPVTINNDLAPKPQVNPTPVDS